MPGRERHQAKDVEKALRFAEREGFTVEVRHAGHVWGWVVAGSGQHLSVWSTPRNPGNHATQIRRFVERER